MCGIVGYVGHKQAKPILFDCLARLEYRGYDGCGVAIENDSGISVYKDADRVAAARQNSPNLSGTTGIGHTRWATHGVPSKENAHPQMDCSGKIAVVHNGIISNHADIKQKLLSEGHRFSSETDTEVIPHLIEKYAGLGLEMAVEMAISIIEGSYAIAVLSQSEGGLLVVARKNSPLVIGCGDGENYIASDMPAIIHFCHQAMYLEDGDIGVISSQSVVIKHGGEVCYRTQQTVDWCQDESDISGYEHYMLKEIHEQPKVLIDTIREVASSQEGLTVEKDTRGLSIVACGTSYHAGLIGAYIIEELLGIPTRVSLGSEFNHRRVIYFDEAIALTQSGETADVLYAMRNLISSGTKVLAITNVPGSTASRLATRTVYFKAGTEVSVAATKSFTGQLAALCQLVMGHRLVPVETRDRMRLELDLLHVKAQQVFKIEQQIAQVADYVAGFDSAFFIGRGINYPVALEGALKLKEVSYIHAEGYAAGELKHGPLALINHGMPVIAIVIPDANYESMITSIKEAKAREAYVIAIADDEVTGIDEIADVVLRVPHTDTLFSPIINSMVLQLLAYYTAKKRGCPIDFPRNLAKSVTVD